jgi:predicted DNA-binding transcriptional regulator AlpA
MVSEWSVRIEAVASQAVDPDLLAEWLHDRGVDSPSFDQVDPRRVGAALTVRGKDLVDAAAHAVEMVMGVLPVGSSVVAVEAMTTEEQDALLDRRSFPELAGAQELAARLGVSRQRLYELMRRPDFPAPIADLASGPVWDAASVNHFIEGWSRKPGRPKKPTELLQEAIVAGKGPASLFPRSRR